MQWLMASVIALAMALGGVAARMAGDEKAAQLLGQARAALGGDKNLNAVQGLSCAGSYARTLGDRQMSGELTLDLQLPDKMLRTETSNPIGDMTIVVEQGVNGEKLLRSQRTLNGPPGAILRMAAPPANADGEAQAVRNARADMTRLLLALVLAPPPSMPLEYAYGGEAQSDEGAADVVLMLQYRGLAPLMRIQTQTVQGPPDPERMRRAEQAAHDAAAAQPPPQPVDITLFVDDYKTVNGVQLPHHFSRSIDGTPIEEMTCKTIRINPSFKADAFAAK